MVSNVQEQSIKRRLNGTMTRFLSFLAVTFVCLTGSLAAQGQSSADSSATMGDEAYRFYDQAVDPDLFLIRPGEELNVSFIQSEVSPLTLSVDPEGKIVHSTVGVFDMVGLTLAQARELLQPALSLLYNVEQMTISVSRPRPVGVSITGAVEEPGVYRGYMSQRVSELIALAGGLAEDASSRCIRFSGGPRDLTVDLDRAQILGDNSGNPCLYAGSAIHVPPKSGGRVQVVGEVNLPREIELLPGDDVSALLSLAGGLSSDADPDSVRFLGRGPAMGPDALTLQAGDVIVAPQKPVHGVDSRLTVFGAVANPGRYEFESGVDLAAVIDRAGGFSPDAAEALVTVFRRADRDEWGRRTNRRFPISGASATDSHRLSMVLRASDSIFVPYSVGYVKVSGEVSNPGMYPYVEDRGAAWYIAAAGGYLPTADRERIEVFNRVARVSSPCHPETRVHDGYEVIVGRVEERP